MPYARAETTAGAFAIAPFRSLWIAMLVSNVGTWFQNVTAAWLMTSLSRSTVMVAMVQAASTLPVLLFGLPAGALADIVDRRRLLLVAMTFMSLLAFGLAAVQAGGALTAPLLLAFVFAISIGAALTAPAYQALVPELVPRRLLGTAVALNGANMNLARALGPALAGLLLASTSAALAFAANAASFLGVIGVLARWKPRKRASRLPPEPFPRAIVVGLRFVRHSADVRAVLVRSATFALFGASLWGLLPVAARERFETGPLGYGVLLAAMGTGAVLGAIALVHFRRRVSPERSTRIAWLAYAAALATLGASSSLGLAIVACFFAGAAWTNVLSTLSISVQVLLPAWVRARGLAASLTAVFGGMAFGSIGWGIVAQRIGLTEAFELAAAGLVVSLLPALGHRLPTGDGPDLAPSNHVRVPDYGGAIDGAEGPVLVLVEYDVAPADAKAFRRAARHLRPMRLRSGAIAWDLYRDPERPGRFVETFVDHSWDDHLRYHERITEADRRIQQQVLAFHRGETPPRVTHLVSTASRGSLGRMVPS